MSKITTIFPNIKVNVLLKWNWVRKFKSEAQTLLLQSVSIIRRLSQCNLHSNVKNPFRKTKQLNLVSFVVLISISQDTQQIALKSNTANNNLFYKNWVGSKYYWITCSNFSKFPMVLSQHCMVEHLEFQYQNVRPFKL